MDKKSDLTLRRLKNTSFENIYTDFLKSDPSHYDYSTILELAIIFLNSKDIAIYKLGYSIIIQYTNKTSDYTPLYHISINTGLYPIANFIQKFEIPSYNEDSFFTEINSSFLKLFKKGNIYQTYEQAELYKFFKSNIHSDVSIVAPTSYGKSNLITDLINIDYKKKICIITPTKSLLAQTKKLIIESSSKAKKIITYPDMYFEDIDHEIIAVLTQERLLRLLKDNSQLYFDHVVIDEAHNLLESDARSTLLASVILLLEKRNPKIKLKYLTPFIEDSDNLKVKFSNISLKSFSVDESVKSEKYFTLDMTKPTKELKLYDQFINKFISLKSPTNHLVSTFIEEFREKKNIIYLNTPKRIEEFASELIEGREVVNDPLILTACNHISDYVHPQYKLVECLRKGVIYHHGAIPESIRFYIEELFINKKQIEHVITNSTLLEGVNLPALRLFMLEIKKGKSNLSESSFKNLVGRIARFGDIFKNESSLEYLAPHVYILKSKYMAKNANIEKFISSRAKMDKTVKDKPENVLLETTEITTENQLEYVEALEFIENIEKDTIKKKDGLRYSMTNIGKSSFRNNAIEIPILRIENYMQSRIEQLSKNNERINSTDQLMEKIGEIFFPSDIDYKFYDHNFARIRYKSARAFYTMILNWRIKSYPFSFMINSFVDYWNKQDDSLTYVGRWGDRTLGDGHLKYYTDIKTKSETEKINLAIVRIKEEQDFVDNILIKYIEILHDLDLLDNSYYLKIKYGTDNQNIITLIQNGISPNTSKIIVDQYDQYVKIDTNQNYVAFDNTIIDAMRSDYENEIIISEIERHFIN